MLRTDACSRCRKTRVAYWFVELPSLRCSWSRRCRKDTRTVSVSPFNHSHAVQRWYFSYQWSFIFSWNTCFKLLGSWSISEEECGSGVGDWFYSHRDFVGNDFYGKWSRKTLQSVDTNILSSEGLSLPQKRWEGKYETLYHFVKL